MFSQKWPINEVTHPPSCGRSNGIVLKARFQSFSKPQIPCENDGSNIFRKTVISPSHPGFYPKTLYIAFGTPKNTQKRPVFGAARKLGIDIYDPLHYIG